jgi:hypothetical protein
MNVVLLTGVTAGRMISYNGRGSAHNKPEFIGLMNTHGDRLRALMKKPVLVTVHWEDGDQEAFLTSMPVNEKDPNKVFENFKLPFPLRLVVH